MKHFLKRVTYFSLVVIIPLIALFFSYLYFDPFKVIGNYKDFSYPSVIPNRDYISTTMFLNNHKKYGYNSFIFGSSRTLALRPDSWHRYLSPSDKPFMFDASAESIYGVYTKLRYLDSMNAEIRNVIILICRDVTFKDSSNQKSHLFIKHPAVSHESVLDFNLTFFESSLNPKFLYNFYAFKILGAYKPFMSGYLENRKIKFDTVTNAITIIDQETEIMLHPVEYYAKRDELFFSRAGETIDSIPRINNQHLYMLKEIKRILEKNKTNYKVVISPLYEQTKFNPVDFMILRNEFGQRLYDFSGKNEYTDNKTNYYETSHFRPNIGDSIYNIIYSGIIWK